MKVTVIGAGNMGAAFVKQLSSAGHEVRLVARNVDKARELVAAHAGVQLVPAAGAAMGADAVIVATPFAEAVAALSSLGDLHGKVVIDITNPLTSDYMGLTLGHSTSAAEEIAAGVPGAEVVKAFNTLFAQVVAEGANFGSGQTAPTFIASDSDQAKKTASALAHSIGFGVVDAGSLKNARYLEPLAGLNIYLGYGAGQGTSIAPTWIRRD